MLRKICALAFAISFVYGCSQVGNSDLKTIDLERNVGTKTLPFKLNDIADVVSLIEIGNPDSVMLKRARPVCEHEGKLLIDGGDVLVLADISSGSIYNKVGRKGKGPGEYIRVSGAAMDKDGNIYVCDMNPDRVLEYDRNGVYVGDLRCSRASSLAVLPDGKFAVSVNAGKRDTVSLVICDENAQVTRESGLKNPDIKTGMIYLDYLNRQDGNCWFKKSLVDTVYQVTSEKDIPWLVLSKGKYRIPDEDYTSLEKLNSDSYKYISNMSLKFNSRFMYLQYWYAGAMYMDMWDIEQEKLVGRNYLENPGYESIPGFEVEMDGISSHVVPCFMSEKYMVCEFLRMEDEAELFPSLTENSNPVLLVMKFK